MGVGGDFCFPLQMPLIPDCITACFAHKFRKFGVVKSWNAPRATTSASRTEGRQSDLGQVSPRAVAIPLAAATWNNVGE